MAYEIKKVGKGLRGNWVRSSFSSEPKPFKTMKDVMWDAETVLPQYNFRIRKVGDTGKGKLYKSKFKK